MSFSWGALGIAISATIAAVIAWMRVFGKPGWAQWLEHKTLELYQTLGRLRQMRGRDE